MTSTSPAIWRSRSLSNSARVGHFRGDAAHARFVAAYTACLPDHAELFDVPTSYGTVRVYRFDGPDGRPVVLLPGRSGSTPMWADNLPGLVAHRTVYAVDLLGEPGMSVQRKPITGSDDQAQWFGEMLDGLGLDDPHLMGVSFGGWSATNFAVRLPDRATSLVLLDPAMTFAPIAIRMLLASIPMGMPAAPQWYRRWVMRWIAGGAVIADNDPVATLIASASQDFVLRQPIPTRFGKEQLRGLDLPVLALIAGRSVIHDAGRAANTARNLLPQAQVELWPHASHAINGEYPAEIASAAATFWDRADRL